MRDPARRNAVFFVGLLATLAACTTPTREGPPTDDERKLCEVEERGKTTILFRPGEIPSLAHRNGAQARRPAGARRNGDRERFAGANRLSLPASPR